MAQKLLGADNTDSTLGDLPMPRTRLFVLALALVAAVPSLGGADDDKKPMKKDSIMAKKLAAAQKLLGGLAMNDFAAIKENASILNDLSKQAAWKMMETPRYEGYSDEFQRITAKMADQARDRNIDAIALSYVDMTLTCVKCHQHVRETKIGRAPSNERERKAQFGLVP